MKLGNKFGVYVLPFSFLFSVLIFLIIKSSVPSGTIQTIKLTQIYALCALTLLYSSLLVTHLVKDFKWGREVVVSALYFGVLHVYLAFFKQLGGFFGLGFLSPSFLLAVTFSFFALLILLFMFVMTRVVATVQKWKKVQKLAYLAGFLILIHAMMLGTHFADLSKSIPQIFFVALSILLILEARRLDEVLTRKFVNLPTFSLFGLITSGCIVYFLFSYVFTLEKGVASLGIHSQHILDAKQDAANGTKLSVSVSPINNIQQNKFTPIQFKVFNAITGEVIKNFSINQEKIMHLIIISDDLKYFDHVHPDYKDGIFSINYKFVNSGNYHLYADFKPEGMSEQYYPFNMVVGSGGGTVSKTKPEFTTETVVGGIKAQILLPKNMNAKDLNAGTEIIGLKLTNDKTGEDLKNIEPYLGAFGHLIMVNTVNYEYVHIHPKQAYTPIPGETAGPIVQFSPLGIYNKVNPGTYKLFAQFQIDGKMHVFSFFAKVN